LGYRGKPWDTQGRTGGVRKQWIIKKNGTQVAKPGAASKGVKLDTKGKPTAPGLLGLGDPPSKRCSHAVVSLI
jgi:hypothetical protein